MATQPCSPYTTRTTQAPPRLLHVHVSYTRPLHFSCTLLSRLSRTTRPCALTTDRRLVEKYEKQLAEVHSQLHASQSSGERHATSSRQQKHEMLELKGQLRAATTRAELAEGSAKRANADCSVWNSPLAGAFKASATRMGGMVHGATEQVVGASKILAKETGEAVSSMAKEAAPSALGARARRIFDEFSPTPVG